MLTRKALRPALRRLTNIPKPRNQRLNGSTLATVKRPLATSPSRSNHPKPLIPITVHQQRRSFLTSLPTYLVPPVVFTGLLLALWTYKVFMTVVFQEKILYMSYMPPQTRSEKIEDYAATCRPVEWEELRIKSMDGIKISLGVGGIPSKQTYSTGQAATREVVICYFQGNGGSVPPRLPLLSHTLKLLQSRGGESTRYTMVALSYRGYWKSSGRATEAGIKLDAQATLNWIKETHPNARIVLWGQSLGAGVACAAAAEHLARNETQVLQGLILETPFTSVSSMLKALYPERWLPYRYLTGFLRSHWDSELALRRIASVDKVRQPQVLLCVATRDEVVPPEEADKLQRVCEETSLVTKRVKVIGALHNEATTRREGQEAVASFVVATSSR
jgi:pimeloyl-ACP methyl ester carboxylesterase